MLFSALACTCPGRRGRPHARAWLLSAMIVAGACFALVPAVADDIRSDEIRSHAPQTPLLAACLAWRERIAFLAEARERTGTLDTDEGLAIRDAAATLSERCAHRDARPILRQFALLLDLLEDEEEHP